MPKVSVIIPVYNTEKYLARCLDSVVGQTEHDLEIICVNDGSTDSSAAVLERYAASDSRIKIITQENGGLSAARNAGLDVAAGEYAMFVDSDDWIPCDAAEKMRVAAEESGLPVVVSNGCAKDTLPKVRAAHCRWSVQKPALARFVANRRIHSSACNKLYHREAIGARRFISGIYFEDWPFNTELFADIPAFAMVDEPMYVYTTGNASITRSVFSMKKAESYLTGINHIARFFRGRPNEDIARRRIAMAVKMLVSKAVRSSNPPIRALVATQDFSSYPLDLKTRFRLWKMRKMQTSRIVLTGIEKRGREAVYSFSVSARMKKYFREKTMRVTYPESVESIPDSVLAVPFVANLAPLVWMTDGELIVSKLDAAFLDCLDRVRDGYRQMFANRVAFVGKISAVQEGNVPRARASRAASFFSGGLDSVCTLLSHLQERPDLLVVWGADIKYDNLSGWNRLENVLQDEARHYDLPLLVIRSTFRRMLNTRRLNRDFKSILGDEWWHGVQHGLALLGHCAPLAYARGYETMYIASSCTDLKAICASSPLTDNEFRCVNCRAVHDGFELNRVQKTAQVLAMSEAIGLPNINLHVCWRSRSGENCRFCEKCLRTIAGILANGGDPERLGFSGYGRSFDLEAAKDLVVQELLAHRDIGNGIANWSLIGKCLRQRKQWGVCPPAIGEFLIWLAAFDFDNDGSWLVSPQTPVRRHFFAVSRKHNDVRYALGGVTLMKRTARRTEQGARFAYFLFSKIPVWRREDRTVSSSGPSDVPAGFHAREVDLAPLLAELRQMEPFTYVPNPGNAGDALIAAATLQFFDRHGLRYRMFAGDCSGNVVLGGGGGFVAQYPKFVRRVQRVTAPSDHVLILPSTFRGVDGFLSAIDERFTLFARDGVSFSYIRQSGTRARTFLGHDMSLCLTDEIFRRVVCVSVLEKELQERISAQLVGKRGELRVMRTDVESSGPQAGDIDLSKCHYLNERSSPDWIFFGTRMFLEAINRFDTIVTDRLHVGIGAILLGKQLRWRDDRYHKIRDVYVAEFADMGSVRFMSSNEYQEESKLWEERATF